MSFRTEGAFFKKLAMIEFTIFFFFLFCAWLLLGLRSIGAIFIFAALEWLMFTGSNLIAFAFGTLFSFKKADERELRAEDDIILQATAFSQAALWIYLNLVPPSEIIILMQWLVPSAAVLLYAMRAYAKLKNTNLWRYRSMYVLFFVATFSIMSVLAIIVSESIFKSFLIIEGRDISELLLIPLFPFPMLLTFFFSNGLTDRYGLERGKGRINRLLRALQSGNEKRQR